METELPPPLPRPEIAPVAPPQEATRVSTTVPAYTLLEPEAEAKPRNYFTRHWRGELSLPVSYWVNGILTGGMVVLAAKGSESLFQANLKAGAVSTLAIFAF